jgi:hypothetical protein
MALCAVAFLLIRAEESVILDKFGAAVSSFITWCAFAMLLMAGTYGTGIVLPGIAGACVLTVRTMNFSERLTPFAKHKLPVAIGALLCSVVAWIGVLNLMEDFPNA